jgi:hypothetical protein
VVGEAGWAGCNSWDGNDDSKGMSLTIDMTWTPLLEDYLSTALPSPNKIGLRWRGSDRMQDSDVLNMLATFCLAACVGLATT